MLSSWTVFIFFLFLTYGKHTTSIEKLIHVQTFWLIMAEKTGLPSLFSLILPPSWAWLFSRTSCRSRCADLCFVDVFVADGLCCLFHLFPFVYPHMTPCKILLLYYLICALSTKEKEYRSPSTVSERNKNINQKNNIWVDFFLLSISM